MAKFWGFVIVLIVAMMVAGCVAPEKPTLNEVETAQVASSMEAIVKRQPVPDLGGYSREREALSQIIYERNRSTPTWTYLRSMTGEMTEICPSIGYGIPYATQITAPERLETGGYHSSGYWAATVPQAEPNTLYSPESAAATWLICVIDGKQVVLYIEDDILVLPYRIKADHVFELYDPASAPSWSLEMPTDEEVKAKAAELERQELEAQATATGEPTLDDIGAEK